MYNLNGAVSAAKTVDTTPVPQDNTAEPADAFLSGMQDPVTSQPQADVYQDMKEVHYLEPKQPQQTEAFVPLESRVETSVVETSAPEVPLHMDTQPACASQKLAPAQELEQSDSDKFDAVPPKLPWNDNMDAAEEPTVIPTQNLQSTGVPRPKAVPPKAPQTAAEATVVGQELAKKQKEQEKHAAQQPPKPVPRPFPPIPSVRQTSNVTKKGTVLTQMSKFWFDLTEDILPNHMISVDTKDMPEFFQEERYCLTIIWP